jgi:8-oxo-dGTP pyrophosphatase MutT (NUDIX family)
MKRTVLLEQLKRYEPSFKEEIDFKHRMISFIHENPDCFERTLEQGHITASAWLLNNEGSKALLMHHAKLNAWFQLGGHCDGDPDVVRVAIKEAQEESGILGIEAISRDIFDIDIHLIPENKKEKAHYHYDVRFLLRVASDEQMVQNHESKELRWFANDPSLVPNCNRSTQRMFEKWQHYSLITRVNNGLMRVTNS